MKQTQALYKTQLDTIAGMVKSNNIDIKEIEVVLSSTTLPTPLQAEEVKEVSSSSSSDEESSESDVEESKEVKQPEFIHPKRNWKEWRNMHGKDNDFNQRRRMLRRRFYHKEGDEQDSFHHKKKWRKHKDFEGDGENR